MRDPLTYLPASLVRPVRITMSVASDMAQRNIGLLAAGVAFYGLLAVFPGLAALIALWGVFADPDVVQTQMETFKPIVPEAAYDIIADQASALASGPTRTLGWATLISLGAAFWATRSGVAALVRGLNAAYQVPARSGLWPMIMALFLTALLMGVTLVALATVVLAPVVLAFLPLGPYAGLAVNVLRWVVGIGLVFLGIALLYRYGPNRPSATAPLVSPGAVLAVLLWGAVSVGFSSYLENFGNYDAVYGSLGAVIALLMWFYLSAYVVMLGALLNAAQGRSAGSASTQDTTPRTVEEAEALDPAIGAAPHDSGPESKPESDNNTPKP